MDRRLVWLGTRKRVAAEGHLTHCCSTAAARVGPFHKYCTKYEISFSLCYQASIGFNEINIHRAKGVDFLWAVLEGSVFVCISHRHQNLESWSWICPLGKTNRNDKMQQQLSIGYADYALVNSEDDGDKRLYRKQQVVGICDPRSSFLSSSSLLLLLPHYYILPLPPTLHTSFCSAYRFPPEAPSTQCVPSPPPSTDIKETLSASSPAPPSYSVSLYSSDCIDFWTLWKYQRPIPKNIHFLHIINPCANLCGVLTYLTFVTFLYTDKSLELNILHQNKMKNTQKYPIKSEICTFRIKSGKQITSFYTNAACDKYQVWV